MERKIGEIFEYFGTTLEVVENEECDCEGCYFYYNGCFEPPSACGSTRSTGALNNPAKEVLPLYHVFFHPSSGFSAVFQLF